MDANGTPAENVAESRLIRWKRERKEPYRFGDEVRVAAQEAERFAVAGDAELLFEATLPSTHGVNSQFLSGQCDELRDAQTEFPEFRQMVEFDHEVILRGPFIREWRVKRSGNQAVIEAVGRNSLVVDDESRIERVEHDNNAFWRLRSFAELIVPHLENAGVPMPSAALHGGDTSEGRLLWWARAVVKGCPVSSQETNCDNAFLTIRQALRQLTVMSPSGEKSEADAPNSGADESADAWLPLEASAYCLTMLRAVQWMRVSVEEHRGFHPLEQPRKSQSSDELSKAEWTLVTPGDDHDDYERRRFDQSMKDLAWLRRKLPHALDLLGLPAAWGNIPEPDFNGLEPATAIGWRPHFWEVRKILVATLQQLESLLTHEAFSRGEIPRGWQPRLINRSDRVSVNEYPSWPIRDAAELVANLRDWQEALRRSQYRNLMLDDIRREIVNAHDALSFWEIPNRPDWPEKPKDIDDAARQLQKLIDGITPAPKVAVDRQSKLSDSMPLGDWIAQQLEWLNTEPGNKPINYHTSVWTPVAKANSAPGPSSVKVNLTADDPAQLVVEDLQTRLERESVSLRDEFAKRFAPVEKTVLTIRDLRFSLQWTANKLADDRKMSVTPPAETKAATDDSGEADDRASSTPAPKVTANDINDGEFVFVVGSESVEVRGFGETVPLLLRTEGIDRLIAIVTAPTRRVSVMELARIGVRQPESDDELIDRDDDGLTERESVNDERFGSALGEDALQAVRDAVGDLMAERDAAADAGDDDKAKRLTEQINASLDWLKPDLQKAAAVVRKSLGRTYDRLRKDGKGKTLAAHFKKWVIRPRQSSDYVYQPDESDRKIMWKVK